jgi:hypothetical protein
MCGKAEGGLYPLKPSPHKQAFRVFKPSSSM